MTTLHLLASRPRPLYAAKDVEGRTVEVDRIDVEWRINSAEALGPHPAARHTVRHWTRILAAIVAREGAQR